MLGMREAQLSQVVVLVVVVVLLVAVVLAQGYYLRVG